MRPRRISRIVVYPMATILKTAQRKILALVPMMAISLDRFLMKKFKLGIDQDEQ